EAGTDQHVSPAIAEHALDHPFRGKGGFGIEPSAESSVPRREIRVGDQGGARGTRTDTGDVRRHDNRVWRPALVRRHTGDLPPSEDVPYRRAPVLPKEGQFVDVVHIQQLRSMDGRQPVVCARVVRILWAARRYIEGARPGI